MCLIFTFVTPAPAPPLRRSRVPSCPSIRTPVTIITRIRASLDSPGLHHCLLYICLFLSFTPVSALTPLCFPCPDAVRVLFHVCYWWNIHSPCLLLVSRRLSSQPCCVCTNWLEKLWRIPVALLTNGVGPWWLLRGERLIIMAEPEHLEWHQTPGNHGNHVFDTISPIPLQPLPRARPPQLCCH